MIVHSSPLKTLSLALLFTIGGAFSAYADDPTPAAVESARTIISAWGMPKSFDLVVPQMFDQLEHDVVKTRPELETPDVQTADFAYLRLRKEDYSAKTRKALTSKVAADALRGDVFVYFKHEDTPEGALHAEEMLKSVGAV